MRQNIQQSGFFNLRQESQMQRQKSDSRSQSPVQKIKQNYFRSTKILCQIHENIDINELRSMVNAGMNCIVLDMGQINKNSISKIQVMKSIIEKELNTFIATMVILKGKNVNIGAFKNSNVFIEQGSQIRLVYNEKLIGDQNIIHINDDEFLQNLKINDKIIVDYDQKKFRVVKQLKSERMYFWKSQISKNLFQMCCIILNHI